jgi:LPS sulfotransferase NodH
MHLIVTVATPRSGFHMLHSMLAADSRVLDVGCLAMGETQYDYRGQRFGVAAFSEIARAHPDRVVVGNIKRVVTPEDVGDGEATFIHLYRRDLLGLHASTLIAQKYGCWCAPPVGPVSVTVDAEMVDEWTRLARENFQRVRGLLAGRKVIEIAYEELSRQPLQAALARIGVEIMVGEPTTPKLSPSYEDSVTNWHDFDPSLYAMDASAADKNIPRREDAAGAQSKGCRLRSGS